MAIPLLLMNKISQFAIPKTNAYAKFEENLSNNTQVRDRKHGNRWMDRHSNVSVGITQYPATDV